MNESQLRKVLIALSALFSNPLVSLSWVRRGLLLKDRIIIDQTYWFHGRLPRVAITDIFPETKKTEIVLTRSFDRTFRTSITISEAAHLASIVKGKNISKVLEIGTFDGNTALLFASNIGENGSVTTVDLPPDFDKKTSQTSVTDSEKRIDNLTPRELVAGQYKKHPLASKITQIYGDSMTLDWSTFGGPFDFIFIDGCHKEAFVRSDSENALKQLTQDGIIVWHDYGNIPDVSKVVDEIAQKNTDMQFLVLEGTRLAIGIKNSN